MSWDVLEAFLTRLDAASGQEDAALVRDVLKEMPLGYDPASNAAAPKAG